ncbi:hypothetical protein [Mycobacteroides abscessus]|uniref:hypothetical protein n=1 Tax=Mycobacteroides abscessus TaxID=36809 RepID=UPI00070D3B24|nr:hypothetical protein [Mycobacteroides abscessus]UBV23933.1 hypothetical protein H8Z59_12855 [Mycolicibacterium fortuitum]ALM19082.1 hypothetical protein AOY11_25175 [Mycobacteroides abscessus]AMU49421.1 hypothetical protein A3O01_04115 [Mycobacteroides abscessus]ANO08094.1 hypothetical protein BAB76_04115 [Mycobacteroides abscessus]MDM3921158.1 hypothetical protein [Mycobacteroides abscessus]
MHEPVWARDAFVNSVWVATGETPEWIADRTDALLAQLGEALGITHWDTTRDDRWEGPADALAAIVRRNPVREALPEGEEGEVIPSEGYSMVLNGAGPSVSVKVAVHAGSIAVGRRVPSHRLHIDLREATSAGITSEVGDAVCAAVASAWRPATLTLTDSATNRLARRGGWKIGAGYRTWISSEVGAVSRVADGLTATELAGGTLISAPDDWSAEQVVAAMTETLAANGLDEVPH